MILAPGETCTDPDCMHWRKMYPLAEAAIAVSNSIDDFEDHVAARGGPERFLESLTVEERANLVSVVNHVQATRIRIDEWESA